MGSKTSKPRHLGANYEMLQVPCPSCGEDNFIPGGLNEVRCFACRSDTVARRGSWGNGVAEVYAMGSTYARR